MRGPRCAERRAPQPRASPRPERIIIEKRGVLSGLEKFIVKIVDTEYT